MHDVTKSGGAALTARPDVNCQRMPDGSAVLVAGDLATALAINATACDVWELCDGRDQAGIVAELLERYEAEPLAVETGVGALIEYFQTQRLLVQS